MCKKWNATSPLLRGIWLTMGVSLLLSQPGCLLFAPSIEPVPSEPFAAVAPPPIISASSVALPISLDLAELSPALDAFLPSVSKGIQELEVPNLGKYHIQYAVHRFKPVDVPASTG